MSNRVLTVYRESFSDVPVSLPVPQGLTVAEMVARMPVAKDFAERGTVTINGNVIAPNVWHVVRPKADTVVTMHLPAAGGGEDGGKAVFAFVASLALTVAAGWIVGGGLATKTGWFAAGSISATVLAGAVSLVGSLLLSALIAPPVETRDTERQRRSTNNASAEGNILEPNASVVRVIGERKVFPPFAAEPFTYFSGPDEIVEAAYILAGPHRIQDIRVGAAPVDDAGIEYEVREGWPGDEGITLIRRQSFTESPQDELRAHIVSDSDNRTLDDSVGGIAQALPQKYVLGTRVAPDEHQFQIAFPQGLFKQNNTSPDPILRRVPMRLRMRRRGSATWRNLPELHFQADDIGMIRATIRFEWVDQIAVTPGAAGGSSGWVEARTSCLGQTVAPSTPDYSADPYFFGSGDSWMNASNLGTTGVRAVTMDRYTCTIELRKADFEPGIWEIEIIRGASFNPASYVSSSYTFAGVVWDFYGYQGTPGVIVEERGNVADSMYLVRSVSIWNENPLPTKDFAIIAIRARNRKVERVSCLAGGYVPDWDGVGWRNWTVTSNPAPHLRDIWTGRLNVDPIDPSDVDETALLTWRTRCITEGYTCNALIQGSTVQEAAQIVAACGYASPRLSDKWGVALDYDRSAETPVQIFTPLNSSNYGWTKAFARVPDGFRVTFDDEDRDYVTDQELVLRPGNTFDTTKIEQTRYEGLTNRADVIKRAKYDQNIPVYRSCYHTFEASAEAIICQKGDLIGVVHETLDETVGFARVVNLTFNGSGNVTGLVLDASMPTFGIGGFSTISNVNTVDDVTMIGQLAGIAVRRTDGSIFTAAVTVSGTTVTLATPVAPAGIEPGCMVSYGRLGMEFLRLVVYSVKPKDQDFTATITAVDEAPELFNAA